jgi:hypothetical protein
MPDLTIEAMNPSNIKPGPIRHQQLSDDLMLRIESVREALAEVCALTQEDWRDAFRRDANPEHELLWWERVSGCYVALVGHQTFSVDQRQAAFNVIFGLFSGLEETQMQDDLAKLPESAMDELAVIVQQLGTVN